MSRQEAIPRQVCKVPRDGGRIKALFRVDSTLLVGAAVMFWLRGVVCREVRVSWIYCWAAMRTRVWRRRGYITHLRYHWEWPVFSKTTVQTSGPIKKVYFCMAPTDVPEPRPRKEPIIFFKKAASRQIVLSWLRVTFKIHKICRFDTPINLGSLMVPSFLGLAQPCSLCQARFEHRSGGGKVWLTMSPTSFHIVPNMAILCLSDFSLKSCHNYLGIQHRSFWWSLWSLHCSFFFASFFHFSIFLLR